MNNLWSKTKTAAQQTKQKAMVKLGRAEETVDTSFNAERDKFNEYNTKLKKLKEDSRKSVKALQASSEAQTAVYEGFLQLYPSEGVSSAVQRGREACSTMEVARVQFEQIMNTEFQEPMILYNQQFDEVKRRTDIRSTRKLDMDRYKHDSKARQAKADPKASLTEDKLARAQMNYDILNHELLQDMPKSYEDRGAFLEPLFSTFNHGFADFYDVAHTSISATNALLSSVPRASAVGYKHIITPREQSAAYAINADGTPATIASYDSASTYQPTPASTTAYSPPTAAYVPPAEYNTPVDTYEAVPVVPFAAAAPSAPASAEWPKPGRVLYDFSGQDETELTVKAGESIEIYTAEGEWWEAQHGNHRGLVPYNYVQML